MRGPVTPAYPDRVTERVNLSSESAYEAEVGYSRAVRTGAFIAVSGTTAPGADIAEQTRNTLQRIEKALSELGASLSNVIRTRIFVTDISRWRDVGAVHAEFFGAVRPTATMVEVAALIEPGLLVEIEADAYVEVANDGNRPSGPG
ncbi:Endoribonuclease L-PSP [Mycolicibacterium rhodesiae JS60]|nr:Endoribonuclease L-PSP [Mycolicibacterium rhodesiae JS60]